MPRSLMDMFRPQDPAGEPVGFGDALTSRSNSLIGLGMGLLSPSNPLRGQSSWGQALEGFQSGAQLDARTAQAAAQRRQHAADRRQAQGRWAVEQKQQDDARRQQQENWKEEFGLKKQQAGRGRIIGSADTGYFMVDENNNIISPQSGATPPAPTVPGIAPATNPAAPSLGAPAPLIPAKQPKLTAADSKAIHGAEDENAELETTVETLRRAKDLNDQTFVGTGASARAWLGTKLWDRAVPDFIADPKGAQATEEWQKSMGPEALKTMAGTLKGATTDFELRKFTEMLADPSTTPETRKTIITRLEKLAARKAQINKTRMDQLRGGTYYKPGGGMSGETSGGQSSTSKTDPFGLR